MPDLDQEPRGHQRVCEGAQAAPVVPEAVHKLVEAIEDKKSELVEEQPQPLTQEQLLATCRRNLTPEQLHGVENPQEFVGHVYPINDLELAELTGWDPRTIRRGANAGELPYGVANGRFAFAGDAAVLAFSWHALKAFIEAFDDAE